MGARLVRDPGKDHSLAALELYAAGERGQLSDLHVIGDIFAIFESAMLTPNLARQLRHATVGLQFLLGDRDDKSIDVLHGNLALLGLPPFRT